MKAVLAKSFARIHAANLINNGIIPLVFADAADYDKIEAGDELVIKNAPAQVKAAVEGQPLTVTNKTRGYDFQAVANISDRQGAMLIAGGLLNYTKELS